MASEVFQRDMTAARFGLPSFVAEGAFIALLLLAFVGLAPFSPRYPEVLALGESGITGAGDTFRQILYLAIFLSTLMAAIDRRGLAAFSVIPVALVALLAWCAASALWAVEPGVTFRRAMLEVVVVISTMLNVQTLGAERSLRLLRGVLIAVLAVNFASIFISSHAIHQPGEMDPGLVGDWRGLYYHKNIAGGVCAISALVFLYFTIARRSAFDFLLFVAALFFTIMTRSKSSLLLLPISIAMGAIYFRVWKRPLERTIAIVILAIVLLAFATILLWDFGAFTRVLQDPAEFTGRTAIWQAEIAFVRDHQWLGAGFGSFADTGAASPLHNYVGSAWIETVAHGHNAYLQILVTIGAIGFVLAICSLILLPLAAFWRQSDTGALERAFLFAIFTFVALHNFLESDFLEGDSALWLTTVIVLAILRLKPKSHEQRLSWSIP